MATTVAMTPAVEAAPAHPLWRDGWYTHARHLPSPNFGPRPDGAAIDLVVVHSISLPPGDFGGGHVQALFSNTLAWDAHPYFQSIRGLEVSSHFFIERQGELWQFVGCGDRAWHAGRSSFAGRGNCNDYSVGIELEGLEGDAFEAAQYETLASLVAALARQYPIAHLAGHEHVAPGRKRDPGPGFDWALTQRMLGWSDRCFPGQTDAST